MKIPIVFSFNDNFYAAAIVCLTSLLDNAYKNTFYDIFIFYTDSRLHKSHRDQILTIKKNYDRCNIRCIDVGDRFKNYKTSKRNKTTIEVYNKFLIPQLLPQYDRVIYSDVDVIFSGDLAALMQFRLDTSLGAVLGTHSYRQKINRYLLSINLDPDRYFNAGFLLFNAAKIRKEDIFRLKILPTINNADKLIDQNIHTDQDLFNIIFKNNVQFLNCKYNHNLSLAGPSSHAIVHHYPGPKKPWHLTYLNHHGKRLWLAYYKKSIAMHYPKYMLHECASLIIKMLRTIKRSIKKPTPR